MAWNVLGLLGVSLALGCSGRNAPTDVSSQSDGLTTSTIKLSAPDKLSPIGPVLEGSNSVTVNSGSTVVSGTVVAMGSSGFSAGVGATANDVWSRGTAHLATNVRLHGTLHASSSVLSLGDVVAGTDTTPLLDPPATLSWTVTYPAGTATNVTVPQNTTHTMTPGLYGTVTVGSEASLTLGSGTYYLTGLSVQPQAKVIVAPTKGPVIVYVSTTIALGGTFYTPASDASPASPPNLLVAYLGTGAFTVGDTSCTIISGTCGPFNGAIVAPNATMTLQALSGGVHTGFFAAAQVVLAANAEVQYRIPLALIGAAHPGGVQCDLLLADAGVPPQQIPQYCTLCSSPDDTDRDGVPDCIDGCPYDHNKIAPGVCGCNIPDTDSDGDGIPDCLEPACAADPNNTTPGQCGCVGGPYLRAAGTPCTDTACPQSGATCNAVGVCGNRAACNPCTGGVLVEQNGVAFWLCDEALPPEIGPDGGRETVGGGTPVSESAAQLACSAKGLTLSRISTADQNALIARLLTAPIWLGANDLATSGQWRWSAPNNNSGDLFWLGGPTGSPQNNLYSNWGGGAPASASCASMLPVDGHWFDTSCNETLGYVCEFTQPAPGLPPDAGNAGWGGLTGANGGGGGGADQPVPMPTACVPEFGLDAGGLPDSFAELQREVTLAREDAGFFGAAANRPAKGQTCPSMGVDAQASENIGLSPDSGAGCWYANARFVPSNGANGATPDGAPGLIDCQLDTDCAQFDGGYVCRQLKDNGACEPPDAAQGLDSSPPPCPGHAQCVQLVCPTVTTDCREVRICPATNTEFDASPDPTTNLNIGPYDPASMFEGGLPDGAPSTEYYDPPMFDGSAHTWCHMNPQNPVANANQPAANTGGSSGHGSPISFSFDPNLEFTVNANPLALGENGMDVHARATLSAAVHLSNFLGQSYSADIIDIGAGIHAQRCSVDNDDTQFTVLGLDVISLLGIGVPHFDSATLAASQTKDCNDAVANFTLWANRAKKAFRDAQQLVSQYKNAQEAGATLAETLCTDILGNVSATDVAFFPGGLTCPAGEPVEMTINRFVDYLQAPGFGEISRLRGAAFNLVNKSATILNLVVPELNKSAKFLDVERDESQTILNVPFAIGPVPMVLQVDVFASYGINGYFTPKITFPWAQLAGLDDSSALAPGDPNAKVIPLAHVTVNVGPYASAGLAAFVGAGVDLGAISATIGIEGRVTLGQVQAPIYAGAGLDVIEQQDPRPIPNDIASAALGSLFQFSLPKSFNFLVKFDYGAGIQLSNILSGEIDARLEISFFFFSATWRAQIVKFNGWSHYYNLVSGGVGASTSSSTGDPQVGTSHLLAIDASTTVVSSAAKGPTMGLAESQLPLVVLQSLPVPVPEAGVIPDGGDAALPPAPVPTIPFDASSVQTFFYDNQCCAHSQEACNLAGVPQCCPSYQCVVPDAATSGTCQPVCAVDGGACSPTAPAGTGCCGSLFCGPSMTCLSCVDFGGACSATQPCCNPGSTSCGAGGTCCLNQDVACQANSDCCNGQCLGGTCAGTIQ